MFVLTKRGLYHQQHDEDCGDVVRTFQDDRRTVIVMADGVSTCKCGAVGAEIAAEAAIDYILGHFDADLLGPGVWGRLMLQSVQCALRCLAREQGRPWEEYSCTLLTAVMDAERNTLEYFAIGDCLLLAIRDDSCPILGMPQLYTSGCPVVTSGGAGRLARFGTVLLENMSGIAAMTDGAWRLMYRHDYLLPDVRQKLIEGRYEDVLAYIDQQQSFDDCGIAIMMIREAV